MFVVETNDIPVAMSVDDRYANMAVVVLTSLLENTNPNTFYDIHILVPGDLKSSSVKKFDNFQTKYTENCKIDLVSMGVKYKNVSSNLWGSAVVYYRLQASSVFFNLKKCIYVDGDVMVRCDLSEMYNINIEDWYVAGVHETTTSQHRIECRELGIPNVNECVCSGVLLMNLEKIRKDNLEEKFSKLIEEKGEVVSKHNVDQSVINAVCHGKILFLPNSLILNINVRKYYPDGKDWEKKNPTVVHFNWVPKPWRSPEHSIFHKEWWVYARKTGFYDEVVRSKMIRRKNSLNKRSLPKRKK